MTEGDVKPQRIRRTRKKGGRLTSPNGLPVVCVTRPGRWGNPFAASSGITPAQAVARFEEWLIESTDGQKLAEAARTELRGRNLACWCPDGGPCHAHVLLRVANSDG